MKMKPRRIQDRNLLDYIKTLPCSICGHAPPSDPSHIKSKGSGGPDADFNIVPKCRKHHQEWHQLGVLTFLKKYPLFALRLEAMGWQISEDGLWNERTRR